MTFLIILLIIWKTKVIGRIKKKNVLCLSMLNIENGQLLAEATDRDAILWERPVLQTRF